MSDTVKKIVDILFQDTVENDETRALHEELMNNCQEHYQDMIDRGLSEDEAVGEVVESLKGMKDLIAQYPKKSAANTVPVEKEEGGRDETFSGADCLKVETSDQDLYATVSYENDYVTPSASAYWNYSDSAGTDPSAVYFSFALSRDFSPVDDLTLTPKAEVGFGDHAYTGSAGGTELTDQTLGFAAKYAFTTWFSVGAQINYTWTPSRTLRHEGYMGEGKHQIVWGGINATFSF